MAAFGAARADIVRLVGNPGLYRQREAVRTAQQFHPKRAGKGLNRRAAEEKISDAACVNYQQTLRHATSPPALVMRCALHFACLRT